MRDPGCLTGRSFKPFKPMAVLHMHAVQSSVCRHGTTCRTPADTAGGLSRRDTLLQLSIAFISQQSLTAEAAERRGIGRYIKKKALDPLVTYVPAVLLAREELLAAGKVMGDDPTGARIALRSGAFEGLRDNVRALGEYATTNKTASERDAKDLVDKAFLALSSYDYVLFDAVRNKQPVGDRANELLQGAVTALDSLLATVPQPIYSQAQDVVRKINEGSSSSSGQAQPAAPSQLDAQQLRKLLA